MAAYWMTFRIADDGRWALRYHALVDTVRSIATGPYWDEPTSFFVFESALPIDDVAARVSRVLNMRTDVAVIGMPEWKSARVLGDTPKDDALFRLMPFAKYYIAA